MVATRGSQELRGSGREAARGRHWRRAAVVALSGLVLGMLVATAAAAPSPHRLDAAGGTDHPLLQRFEGSWLIGWRKAGFAEARPLAMLSDTVAQQKGLNNRLAVEGEATELYYVSPPGRSSQEVQRAYEDLLKKAGAVLVYSCSDDSWGCYTRGGPAGQMLADGAVPRDQQAQVPWGTSLAFGPMSRNLRLAVHRLTQKGTDTWVTVYTVDSPPDVREFANSAASYVQVVQPRPPEPERPPGTLTATQLAASLASDGRVVLPPLAISPGRRPQFKKEAGPQLAEVAKLLVAKPDLRLYVVAHTDYQADKRALAQSRKEAELVVTALTRRFGIARDRVALRAVGAAAPLARNNTEAGRARNRRLELVERPGDEPLPPVSPVATRAAARPVSGAAR